MSSLAVLCDAVTPFCSPQRQTSPCPFLGARRCGASSVTFVLVSPEKDLEKVQAVYLENDQGYFTNAVGKKGNNANPGANSKQLPTVGKEQPTFFSSP